MVTIPLTRNEFNAKAAELQAKQNIIIRGDEGQISHSGVTIRYHYDGQTLTLEVINRPFFVTDGFVEARLEEWFGVKES